MDALPLPAAPRRILITRISAMGDLVFATPLASALRAHWPQAHIAWLVRDAFAGLLESVPEVDEAIAFAQPRGLAWLPTLLRLRRALRPRRFDLVLEAQGLAKTRLLAACAGGVRIGFDSREPGRWLMHALVDKGGDVRLIGSEYRHFAERLGAESAPPRLRPRPEHRDRAAELLARSGITGPWIALCPFTTRPQKHWPDAYWPELARLLAPHGLPLAILGGPGDAARASAMAEAAGVPVAVLAGRTPVALLPALLESAALVIGVDTGLTHIGVAVRTPTVALFGSTCPYTTGAEGPLTVLYDALPCSPCRRRPTCGGRYDCMRQLTPERVQAAARELMEATAR